MSTIAWLIDWIRTAEAKGMEVVEWRLSPHDRMTLRYLNPLADSGCGKLLGIPVAWAAEFDVVERPTQPPQRHESGATSSPA